MKICIEPGLEPLKGYLNIYSNSEVLTKINDQDIEAGYGLFTNLDPIIGNENVEEIVFSPPLNIIKPEHILFCLKHFYEKLSSGAIIRFMFLDFLEIARRTIYSTENELQNTHMLVYGPGYSFKSILTIKQVLASLENVGFKMKHIQSQGSEVTIVATKN